MAREPRVFISYPRKDGEQFAKALRQRLEREDIPLWQDRVGMKGGRDWWLQIVEALDKVEYMVLVMTPEAIDSPIIRKEWRYARQKGVCVYPVKGVPDSELDYESLPRWMSSAHFYDLEKEWPKFVNDLNTRCEIPRVPFMVEDLSEDFIPRPEEFDRLISQLLDADREEPVAITAALRGAGGYGKTTLAQAICHDEGVQFAFEDGILWVTLGQRPGDLTAKVNDIIEILTDKRPGFTEIQPATARLTELLADRDILFVIDDVWNRAHLNPFLQGGHRCARLITTRNSETLPPRCEQIDLDAMNQEEARRLLGFDLPLEDGGAIGELSDRLGEWPLLLKLVNGALRDRVKNRGQSLPDGIAFVNKALDRHGLTAFDYRNPEDRSQAVSSTLGISMDLLSDEEKVRYSELAIFPEDLSIPLETVEKLWQHADFDDFETEILCERLHNLSLLLNFDLNTRQISLHDVVRKYLRTQHSSELKTMNTRFLSAYGLQNWADLPENEPYLWKYIAYHLVESGQADALKELLLDFFWLKNKLAAYDVNALLSDYDFFQQDIELKYVQSALRLSSYHLSRDRNQLTGHLLGRFMDQKLPKINALLEQATREKTGLWLRLLSRSLTPPDGPLLRILAAHTSMVSAVAMTPDGKTAVSGSHKGTLKVWDLITGNTIYTLKDHRSRVTDVAMTPDGKTAVSGSGDRTVKVWDLTTGKLLHALEGHSDGVRCVAITPDGKTAISGSGDGTVKVWDLTTGKRLHALKGHGDDVLSVAITPDGKTGVSGSMDTTLKVWDLASNQPIHTLKDHSDGVSSVAIINDGKTVVSSSFDHSLKVWDLTGGTIHTLEGHREYIVAMALSADGKRAITGSIDRTIKVWDLTRREKICTLPYQGFPVFALAISGDGRMAISGNFDKTLKIWDLADEKLTNIEKGNHISDIYAIALTPDGGRGVTGSWDKTLKIWDLTSGKVIDTLEGHSDEVLSVAMTPDGKTAVSGSKDKTLKVWDLTSGQVIDTLEGHRWWVYTVAMTSDGKRAVSGSGDRTLKVWDLTTRELIYSLEGYSDDVLTVAMTPDGKTAVSGSRDSTLNVWDLTNRKLMNTLKGHSPAIVTVAMTPDGKTAVSGSLDRTLKVWNLTTGNIIQTLEGHSDEITNVSITPNGKTAVSGALDQTLRVWDLTTGEEMTNFIGDSGITACAITAGGRIIVAGDGAGQLHILRLEGI
jgi:WD40 repeat protein